MPSRAVGNLITIEKSSKIYKEYRIKTTNFINENVFPKRIYFKSVPYFDVSYTIGSSMQKSIQLQLKEHETDP